MHQLTVWIRTAVVAFVWVASAHALGAGVITGKVVSVADGDTITVLDESKAQHRVRIAGIDAPERGQPFGTRSRQSMAELAFGKQVTVEWHKEDRYGRKVAKVLAPVHGCLAPCSPSLDVGLAQLDAGMAWWFRDYRKEQPVADRQKYEAAEATAKRSKMGLWSRDDAVAPWAWRRMERR